jgi:hypothetical protein
MNQQLTVLITGLVVPFVTSWLKNAKWFSVVSPEQSARVQALAAVLSAVAGFLGAYATGSFDESMVKGLIETLVMAVPTLGISALIHHWVLRKKN